MFKKFLALGFSIVALSTAAPVFAQDLPYSEWALEELQQINYYGIYPLEWITSNEFKATITKNKFETLINNVDNKLLQLGFEQIEGFEFELNDGSITKENLLHSLYQLIEQYHVDDYKDGVDYFVENGLILGSNGDLKLDEVPTTQEAVILAGRFVEHVFNEYDKAAKGFAWEVQHEDNTVYLLGSIHAGIDAMYPLNAQLMEAYNSSDFLAVEANIFELDDMEWATEYTNLPDGTTIDEYVSAETYDKLIDAAALLGLSIEDIETFSPLNLATVFEYFTIYSYTQADDMYGIDVHFLERAISVDNKPIIELEGAQRQIECLYSMSAELMETYLAEALELFLNPQDNMDNVMSVMDYMNHFIAGDSQAMKVDDIDDGEFKDVLLTNRDEDMTIKISDFLEQDGENTYFVVVGAFHYCLDGGIVDRLEDMGYEVTPFYE
ncbi:MAG: hypothetical protein ATN34_04825 [Epulopiscium sp. Nele67-Bin002]|nr:MAG: hypothetical protein ATN34_04825 [Epulopiscium sp. Nele67-Bin002]